MYGVIDRVFSSALLRRGGRTEAEVLLGAEARIYALHRIVEPYQAAARASNPEAFFGAPGPAAAKVRRRRTRVLDVRWDSGYEPFNPDVAEDYLAHQENRTCSARLLLKKGSAKGTVILIHGYLGGRHVLEQRVWPMRLLHGADHHLALFVLPFHGSRRKPLTPFVFPGSDPRISVEGFRQTVFDLARFIGWLEKEGYGPAGVMGMSLGGYTSALLATVEPRLHFSIPIIPLSSVAKFARQRGRFIGSSDQQDRQEALIEQVYAPVSPLLRPPLVPEEGRLVVAGAADRICPMEHAEEIAAHFDTDVVTFPGGHLMQVGRGRAFKRIAEVLERL